MTDTEQLLSDSIDKISELSIENHRLKAQIEKMKCCEICAKYKDWRNRSLCVECEQSKSHINFELRG